MVPGVRVEREARGIVGHQDKPATRNPRTINIAQLEDPAFRTGGIQFVPDEWRLFRSLCRVHALPHVGCPFILSRCYSVQIASENLGPGAAPRKTMGRRAPRIRTQSAIREQPRRALEHFVRRRVHRLDIRCQANVAPASAMIMRVTCQTSSQMKPVATTWRQAARNVTPANARPNQIAVRGHPQRARSRLRIAPPNARIGNRSEASGNSA